MKKIIIMLCIVGSLFASVESEVEKSRFSHKNGVLTDSFAGMEWQDNEDAKTVKKNWQGAKNYCADLTLAGKYDWRLPSKAESKFGATFNYKFKNTGLYHYWSSTTWENIDVYAWDVNLYDGSQHYYRKKTGICMLSVYEVINMMIYIF